MSYYSFKEVLNDKLKRDYVVDISATTLAERYKDMLGQEVGSYRMPGYRAGKVPIKIVESRIGGKIREHIVSDMLSRSVDDVVNDIGRIVWLDCDEPTKKSVEDGICYKMHVELMPQLPDIDISEIEVTDYQYEIHDVDVDSEVAELYLQNRVEREDQDRVIQDGDVIDITFDCTIDGDKFDGGSGEKVRMSVTKDRLVFGFYDNLLGLKKGENKIFDFDFPEDYHVSSLAAKTANCTASVENVYVLDEIATEDLLKKYNIQSTEDLRANLKERVGRRVASMNRDMRIILLFTKLAGIIDVDLPEHLVDREYAEVRSALGEGFKDMDDIAFKERFGALVDRRVKVGVFILDYAERNNINVTSKEMNDYVMQQIQSNNTAESMKIVENYISNPEMREGLRRRLIEGKSTDVLLGAIKYNKKMMESYKDLQDTYDQLSRDAKEQ